MSAEFTSKNGFSVVAPTSTTVRFSTACKSESCWLRLKRWISSTNRIVRAPRAQQALFRRSDFAAQIGDGTADGRNFHKRRARRFGDDVRDACFTRTCRSVQNDGRKRIGLNCRMKPTAWPHRVFLPRKLAERTRTHTHGERRGSKFLLVLYFSEQRVQLPPIYRFNTPGNVNAPIVSNARSV